MKKINKKPVIFIMSLILISTVLLSALNKNVSGDTTATKPVIKIEDVTVNPKEALVGEDITVSGFIAPQPFVSKVPAKEVVLVLDTSGSMKNEVRTSVECKRGYEKYCITHSSSECNSEDCDVYEKKRNDRNKTKYWYCNTHRTWINTLKEQPNNPGTCHNFQYDYCEEHGVSGKHTYDIGGESKISALKKAAKAFVKEMSEKVPDLKISIVAFSTYSTINPEQYNNGKYNSFGDSFLNIKDNKVDDMIDSLKADGGTNTGEGLRKAAYMLNNKGDSDANKTIILMSDGIPTFYSCENNGDYYTKLNNEWQPKNLGLGSKASYETIYYSNLMGSEVKKHVNNVFSIGYGLGDDNSEDNKILKGIHESMGGVKENFYASDDGAIEGIFNTIAQKITEIYPVNNVALKLNIPTESITIVGGPKIDIGTIEYTTNKEVTNGEVVYTAPKVPFKYTVKGNKPGDYNIDGNIEVSYPWKGKTETDIEDCKLGQITIKSNELPNIEAKLKSSPIVESGLNEGVTVKYDIIPNGFVYNDESGQVAKKEIVFVIDTSKDVGEENLKAIKQHSWSGLLNKYNNNSKYKFGVVTYNESAMVNSEFTKGRDTSKVINDISLSTSNERNVGKAMEEADKIFAKGEKDADKFVIFLSAGNINYSDQQINNMISKNYNYISLKLGSEESEINEESLLYLHKNILGQDIEDYFNPIEFNEINNTFKEISDRLSVKRYRPYVFSDISLNFNIPNELEVIQGLAGVTNNPKHNYSLKVPKIVYNYNAEQKKYLAEAIEVEFQVKPIEYGELKFNDSNTITYRNLLGNKDSVKGLITPKFTVLNPVEIIHGIYGGNGDNGQIINESEITLAKGANVSFAAKIENCNRDSTISLILDDKITVEGKPEVYEIGVDGKLTLIGEMSGENKNYAYIIPKDKNNSNFIVIYNVNLPLEDNVICKNVISVGTVSKPASIKIGEEPLPNLF